MTVFLMIITNLSIFSFSISTPNSCFANKLMNMSDTYTCMQQRVTEPLIYCIFHQIYIILIPCK